VALYKFCIIIIIIIINQAFSEDMLKAQQFNLSSVCCMHQVCQKSGYWNVAFKPQFHLAPHVSTRHVRHVEHVVSCCLTSSTQPKCMVSTRRTCRVVSRRDVMSQVGFTICDMLQLSGRWRTALWRTWSIMSARACRWVTSLWPSIYSRRMSTMSLCRAASRPCHASCCSILWSVFAQRARPKTAM